MNNVGVLSPTQLLQHQEILHPFLQSFPLYVSIRKSTLRGPSIMLTIFLIHSLYPVQENVPRFYVLNPC